MAIVNYERYCFANLGLWGQFLMVKHGESLEFLGIFPFPNMAKVRHEYISENLGLLGLSRNFISQDVESHGWVKFQQKQCLYTFSLG